MRARVRRRTAPSDERPWPGRVRRALAAVPFPQAAVLAGRLANGGLAAVLRTWARPAAPAVPLAATLAVLLALGR
jgi:hypothetical protein